MPSTLIGEYLFLESSGQLIVLAAIVMVAGMVRGCIGFGFSAIVVASTSFWLPPVAVVNMVILLEVAASVNMLPSVYKDVKLPLLVPLTAGSVVTTLVGTWLLATLSTSHLQWIVGSYMLVVALLTLSGFVFRQAPTRARLFAVGMVAGFFNGLAAVGGLSAAWAMIGFQLPVRDIRAVMTVFFIVAEVLFLSSAWGMGMISAEIITTAVLAIVPLALGIYIGSKLFSRFSEATLKRFVLIALIVLSVMGIYKSIF